jgi:Ni,Fe-hydrogenase maturation factor
MSNKQTILVFGNPLVELDSLAIRILPQLKKVFPNIDFVHVDPTENLQNYGKKLKILDVAPNINEIRIFSLENEKDLDKISTSKIFSMHDFDLGYNLKLLKKLNLIDEAEIICLPWNFSEKQALENLNKIL